MNCSVEMPDLSFISVEYCTLKVSSVINNDKINLLVVLLFLFRLLTFLKNKFEYLQESGKQRLFVRNI